jgi:hypothetical protein
MFKENVLDMSCKLTKRSKVILTFVFIFIFGFNLESDLVF